MTTKNQIGVHNGIITNELSLWENNIELKKETELDTEILLKLIDKEYSKSNNLNYTFEKIYSLIEGTASIANFIRNKPKLLLSTNSLRRAGFPLESIASFNFFFFKFSKTPLTSGYVVKIL